MLAVQPCMKANVPIAVPDVTQEGGVKHLTYRGGETH